MNRINTGIPTLLHALKRLGLLYISIYTLLGCICHIQRVSLLQSSIHGSQNMFKNLDTKGHVYQSKVITIDNRMFASAVPLLWNSLASDIKGSASTELFKTRLMTYFYSLAFHDYQ